MQKQLFVYLIISYALFGNQSFATSLTPGSQCVRWNSSDVVPALEFSEIHNKSATQWMRVDCPIERTDFFDVLHWPALESVSITVADQNFSNDIICRAWRFKRTPAGALDTFTGGFSASDGTSARPQILNLGSVGLPSNEDHAFIECHVPPTFAGRSSSIINYRVDQ